MRRADSLPKRVPSAVNSALSWHDSPSAPVQLCQTCAAGSRSSQGGLRVFAMSWDFATPDGLTHLQLFDARPGSHRFVGVTPDEAHDAIMQEFGQLAWGCFLDPGQTARLVARDGSDVRTFGNRHYLDKPLSVPGPWTWQPQIGRPTASALVIR